MLMGNANVAQVTDIVTALREGKAAHNHNISSTVLMKNAQKS
jgi:hypothetical protein